MIIYAFIFARGGSMGLPGKNIKPLGSMPLLAHSIILAQQLECVKKIYVSTDSDDIAAIAKQFSAEIIPRPAELASNTAPEWSAWQHAIDYVQAKNDYFDIFLSLPTTSPLRIKQDVLDCLAFLDNETDVVITATPSARSPYFNMIVRDEKGRSKLVMESPKQASISSRQEAPETYDITTVAYVSRPEFIMNNLNLFCGTVKSVIIPKDRAVDIDDLVDFKLAEAMYESK